MARIVAQGELDLSTAGTLRDALNEALEHAHLIVLDLRLVRFLDAAGLHAVVDGNDHADAQRARLVVVPAAHGAGRVFDLLGAYRWLTVLEAPDQQPIGLLLLNASIAAMDALPRTSGS